jgi:hypothetical protein
VAAFIAAVEDVPKEKMTSGASFTSSAVAYLKTHIAAVDPAQIGKTIAECAETRLANGIILP